LGDSADHGVTAEERHVKR